MSRAHKLDDVQCSICFDSLFNKRDDLDDVCPIATPDCGHVFHEDCILSWFKAQTSQWLSNQRDRQTSREPSPAASEAPVECPTCRKECYADGETGLPTLHRLYINFSAEMNSQLGSSPIRPSSSRVDQAKEREVMGLARRAKGLGAEVKVLNADSGEVDMQAGLRRMTQLEGDLVSVKAVQGIKKYVGDLSIAIGSLKDTLSTHPLIVTMRAQLAEQQQKVRDAERDMRQMAQITLPQEVQKAISAERKRSDMTVKNLEKDISSLRTGLQEEQVARRRAKAAAEEKAKDHAALVQMLRREADGLRTEKEGLANTVNERSKLLKVYQAKAESRKQMKAENERLQKENENLRAQRVKLAKPRPSSPEWTQSPKKGGADGEMDEGGSSDLDMETDAGDASVQGINRPSASERVDKYTPANESLVVDSSSFLFPSSSPAVHDINRHPTARTFACEIGTSFGGASHKPRAPKKTHSKYFDNKENDDQLAMKAMIADIDADDDDDILVLNSSPPAFPTKSQLKRKANPFQQTKEESEKRKTLKTARTSSIEVIDCTQDTPERPVLTTKEGFKASANVYALSRTGSVTLVEKMGLADTNGRLKRGVMAGAKAKRRA